MHDTRALRVRDAKRESTQAASTSCLLVGALGWLEAAGLTPGLYRPVGRGHAMAHVGAITFTNSRHPSVSLLP